MFNRFQFSCLALALALVGGSAAAPGHPIISVREVRTLGGEALKAGPPVRLRGVVLHRYPGRPVFLMQDESAAIMVRTAGLRGELPAGLVAGVVVEIEGVAAAGQFAPVIEVPKSDGIRVVGTAPLPAPLPLTAEAAQSGVLDAHLVVVEGVVRRTRAIPTSPSRFVVELVFEGTRLVVTPDRNETDWSALVDARVRVTGICSGIWNKQGQITGPRLDVTDPRGITVLRAVPADPFALPARSATDIMRYWPEDAPGHRIRIAGVVLHALPDGRVFIFDGQSRVCVECTSPSAVAAGDVVDAVGFPSMRERSPLLEDAVLRVRGHHAPLPDAARLEADTILEQCKDYDIVQIDAVLLETRRTEAGTDLLVQSGDSHFTAAFGGPGSAVGLPRLKPGTTLSLSGLVLFSFPPPTEYALRPHGFSLLLRSPSDVRIIRQPPWWTSQRLLWVLLGALALIVGALAWAWMLRRRVVAQTVLIADGVKRTATLEERTRLAREFHDTLEQSLSGVVLHLETVEVQLPTAPDTAARTLGTARRLARHCQEETRRAVWDLRAGALEKGGLPAALRETMTHALGTQGPALVLTVQGAARRLPARIEHALVRLAQEAATNIARHARAARVEAALHFTKESVALAIHDDGGGFTPAQPAGAGHFGLLGMRERMVHLGGSFQLTSQPGEGTRIAVCVPLLENPAAT